MKVFPAISFAEIVGWVSSLFLPSFHAICRSLVTELAVPPLSNASPAQKIEPLTDIPIGLEYVLTKQLWDAPALPVESVHVGVAYNAMSPFTNVTPVEVSPARDASPNEAAPRRLMARGTGGAI